MTQSKFASKKAQAKWKSMGNDEALKALEDWQRGVTGKRRRHPGHAEDDLQMQCVRWFRLQFPQLSRLLHHSPNGGRRDAREGARFKKMGTQPGFPDLILLVASQDYHALLIELKTRTGRQQDSQKDYQKRVEAQGYKYVVVRSLQQFMAEMKAYLIVSD
nr:MAG TPA: Nuclease [Bacteriophage sp.]